MDKLTALRAKAKAKAHLVHHAHHYAELAYCCGALAQVGEHWHHLTVGGLAVVVVASLVCGD